MRTFHEKQMLLIEQLPASKVGSFLLNQQTRAVTRVQSWWRGQLGRRMYRQRREHARMVAAAVVIQRTVRKFLRGKQNSPQVQASIPGFTSMEDQERERLQAEVVKYREEHRPSQCSDDQLRCTHDEVQQLLGDFYSRISVTETGDAERTHLLLSKLERDCSLLLTMPRLVDVTDEQMEQFTSSSQPVARMARQMHREEMRATEQPWWKLPLPGSHGELLELLN